MNDLTPCKIERLAELAMDALDRRLMNGLITQTAYDAAVKALDYQTERLWKTARRTIDVAY